MVFGCAIFADEIVRVALGPKWRGAALILRLLSPAMLVFALMNPLSYILRATGKVERSLKIALLIAPVVILGIVVGLRYGPAGVAGGYSIAMLALWIPLVAWAKHGTGITNADYWDCIKRPLVAATAGGGAGVLVKLVGAGVLPSLELLVIELAVAFTVYNLLMIYAMGQKDLYLDVLRQVLRRSRPMAT
jgi:PST family polysaccharide transporter